MSSVIGTGDNYFPVLLWGKEVIDTKRNLILKNDGSITCLSLTVNGVSFDQLLFMIQTKYPTSGIDQYVPSALSIYGPIDQYVGGFPAIQQY
jgi:hypothetical protein